ncbi:MAG TPA: hypothetical protein VMH05_00850 [Bryobacteraceae bacterium]|nr:hypothetical protein [Bryobacteraceae bacterium]
MSTSTPSSLWPSPAAPPSAVVPHAGARRWIRALTPSFADCFFVALMAWLFICGASGWKSLLADGDTGWHIRTGQYILAHHAVPSQDLFSFSKPGAPWFAWEWLSDVALAALFQWGGLKAITLAAGTLIALYATVLLRYALWLGANALLAALVTLLAVGASSMHFLARPHLVTLLLLPACLWLVQADLRKNTRWIWWLVPVSAVWTNLHGGVFMFLACLALFVAGQLIDSWLGRPRWAAVWRHGVLLGGCALATLVNPYGIRLHAHVLEYLRSDWIRNVIQEFQAPTFRSEGQLQFEVLLVAGLVVTGFLFRQRRASDALCILFLAHSSLTSVRHAPLYAAVAAPLIASELSAWWNHWSDGLPRKSVVRILRQIGQDIVPAFRRNTLWPALVVLILAALNAPLKWPHDFPGENFPLDMIHSHAGLLQSGRLLTTDQWGDYIIYSFYPKQKVFVDGRSDFYGEALGQDYLHLTQGAYDWRAILERYGFQIALLPVDLPLSTLLKRDPEWRLANDDHHALLFVRLGPQRPPN